MATRHWKQDTSYVCKIAKHGWVTTMEHAGFKASLMKAERLEDRGTAYGLPPGEEVPLFPIAALPGAPKDWLREAGSYVVPVETNKGFWFDFRDNDHLNTAVLPSVKGMNPITGQKLEGLELEQYNKECPVHKKPFAHGRLCEACGYEWPAQNYICAPGVLWWDGFRQPDGKVRQFYFTDDEARDIASLVIGKKNTVPAFGFAFYKTKVSRTPPQSTIRPYDAFKSSNPGWWNGDVVYGINTWASDSSSSPSNGPSSSSPSFCTAQCCENLSSNPIKRLEARSVSVGAGAEIQQALMDDSLGVDGWQQPPASIMRLYFCFEPQFRQIVEAGGVKDLQGNKAGFLQGLPVG